MAIHKQGERRVSPSMYRLLLTAHIIVAVGWLGTTFAKLVLGVAGVTASAPEVSSAMYRAQEVINLAFPPVAIATIVTGGLLSLGTKWGLLQHYWVASKLALTVGVIATAVQLAPRLVQPSASAMSSAPADGAILGFPLGPTLLVSFSVTHLLMLGGATIISVYKPWGKTWFGQRKAAGLQGGALATQGFPSRPWRESGRQTPG